MTVFDIVYSAFVSGGGGVCVAFSFMIWTLELLVYGLDMIYDGHDFWR
jgi:hypothetical protein